MTAHRTGKRPATKQALPKGRLLHVLRSDTLVSTREIRDAVGQGWQEALAALRSDGHVIEEIVGTSNNRSFRLVSSPQPKYLTEPAPVHLTQDHTAPVLQVTLRVEDVRALLCTSLPPRARDTLVGALMAYEENYK